MRGNAPASQVNQCTIPAMTVRRAATRAAALASTGWHRPRAHADHSFGCGTADRADRPILATDRRISLVKRCGAKMQCVTKVLGLRTLPDLAQADDHRAKAPERISR